MLRRQRYSGKKIWDQMALGTTQWVPLSTQEFWFLPEEAEKVGNTLDLTLLIFRHRMWGCASLCRLVLGPQNA